MFDAGSDSSRMRRLQRAAMPVTPVLAAPDAALLQPVQPVRCA